MTITLCLQTLPKFFHSCQRMRLPDIHGEQRNIELRQEFATGEFLIAISLDERGGRLLSQVIQGKVPGSARTTPRGLAADYRLRAYAGRRG